MWLLGEMSEAAPETVLRHIPLLVKACEFHHYTQHVQLVESFCKMVSEHSLNVSLVPFGFNVFKHIFSGTEYTENDWVRIKVRYYPLHLFL